jgi:nucleotide-binding universal stress UspA family protein
MVTMTSAVRSAQSAHPTSCNRIGLSRILVAVDASASARPAAETAASIAEAFGADLVVFSAAERDRNPDATLTSELVHQLVDELQSPGLDIVGEAAADPSVAVERTVVDVVQRLHPDLVVLGTRKQGRLKAALLGSVGLAALEAAKRSVLIVP